MAKKRKSRTPVASQEPEPVEPVEPEPEPAAEPEPEPEEIHETLEIEDTGIAEKEKQVVGVEEEAQEQEGEDEQLNDKEEDQNDAVSEKNEQQSEIVSIPSEAAAISVNGGETNEEAGEEEEELEEEPVEKLLEPFSKDQLTLLIKEIVAKHPNIADNVQKLADADPVHRKIFVHGLGWEANEETIMTAFGKYGEIEDCKVVKDKISGKSKGYGFILFKHRDGARRALKQPQKSIEGRMTSCQLASAGPVQAPPPTVVPSVSTPPVSEQTLRKIYVSNVSAELEPKKLVEFFSTFGEIEEGPLGLDKQTGKPRGFCLFVYKNIESAKKALEEPQKNFEGQILQCRKAIDGPKYNKTGNFQQPRMQQQHQHQHHQQGYYNHTAKKGRYAGGSGGMGHTGGHLMAPSSRPPMPSVGLNPAVAPEAIGQAVAALLATQGGGMGIGNFLGGIGAGMNGQGVPPMMNNAGYGGQGSAGGFGVRPGMQGGYGGQTQMGQPGVRPHQGGAPYTRHGR